MEHCRWLIKALSEQDLIKLAKKMSLKKYMILKNQTTSTQNPLDAEIEDVIKDEIYKGIFEPSIIPKTHPLLFLTLQIDKADFQISNNEQGNFTLSINNTKFMLNFAKHSFSLQLDIKSWDGIYKGDTEKTILKTLVDKHNVVS